MKIKSIKRGQVIEILEQLNNIPDGTEIVIDLEAETNGRGNTNNRATVSSRR